MPIRPCSGTLNMYATRGHETIMTKEPATDTIDTRTSHVFPRAYKTERGGLA
jgi:hypothetical protein